MDILKEFEKISDFVVIKLGGYAFTVGDLLLLPTFLLLSVLLAKWGAVLFTKRMQKRNVNADVVMLVKRIYYVVITIAVFITTLDILNVPLTAFAFMTGAIAIGFGFGAQNVISNFISGWILLWERPIRIGDFIEVDSTNRGRVESINIRSTMIRRTDGVHILIPNSQLLENTVVNWTLVDRLIRATIKVGVAYGSPCKQVAELIYTAVKEQADTLDEPEPLVIFDDFGDNALMFEVFFWVNAVVERDLRVVKSNIRFRIDELFAEHNIVIAYPQRDVHLDGKLILSREKLTRSE